MKSKKLIPVFAVLTAVCIFILTAFGACSSGGSSSEGSGTTPPDIPGGGEFVNPGDNLGGGGTGELPTETDPISVEGLTFSDLTEVSSDTDETEAAVVSGSDELYTITTAGSYVLTGEFNGGVSVSVGKNEETHIFLKNATIKNADGVALYNENKKSSLIITALNGTENVIENGGTYSLYDGETELTAFTISSIITSVGSNGGMGSMGGPGGQDGQPGRPGGNR
ncbi:MAG TPA: hypothetical protein DHU65_02805 [Clostridiales bacterium]|nr:hypothetical protein [Clostridiales bacterium]